MAKMSDKGFLAAACAAILLLSSGCSNRLVGHGGVHAQTWNGTFGITGHLNDVTIQAGSRVTTLSVIGDGNKIFVEENVTLGKVEIWGENNIINVPETLIIRDDQVGKGTKIIRRAFTRRSPQRPPVEIYEPTNRVMGAGTVVPEPTVRPAGGTEQPAKESSGG
jgi:hypothetical protein